MSIKFNPLQPNYKLSYIIRYSTIFTNQSLFLPIQYLIKKFILSFTVFNIRAIAILFHSFNYSKTHNYED